MLNCLNHPRIVAYRQILYRLEFCVCARYNEYERDVYRSMRIMAIVQNS
jgi:hypothetical protein